MPNIFTDPGWGLLSTSILSTSNCGNPALRLFGFGPVTGDGYGIGYIIKEDGISMLVISFTSKYCPIMLDVGSKVVPPRSTSRLAVTLTPCKAI